MEILITNDDGIEAEGLAVLARAAEPLGRVTVVAPEAEQSASSNAITLRSPIAVRRRPDGRIGVSGTPTDCVLLAMNGLVEPRPDIVLSGVNHGSNMGDDINYSGTVAAAIEATLIGVPAIAFSVAGRANHLFEAPARLIAPIVERMVAEPPPRKTFWNVNFPNLPLERIHGIRVAILGTHRYQNAVVRESGSAESAVYRVGGGELMWEENPEADFTTVLEARCVSVTPVHLDLNHYEMIHVMRRWRWNGPGR
ncbi:MAG: 5'/3'-nucleotidase SurE [Candidatus Eisenbacteria bacterium]